MPRVGRVDRVAHPELEIGRDLVVARAGGVQPPRRRADQLGEAVLDMHVDVLERRILGHARRLHIRPRSGRGPRRSRRRPPARRCPARRASRHGRGWRRCPGATAACRSAIEAFISRISAAGPPANRPPHIALELSLRRDRLSPAPCSASRWPAAIGKRPEAPQGDARPKPPVAGINGRRPQPRGQAGARQSTFEDPEGGDSAWPSSAARRCWSISGRPGARPASSRCRRSSELAARRPTKASSASSRSARTWRRKASVDAFLAERDIGRFAAYLDPEMGLMTALGVQILPTTILYDAAGQRGVALCRRPRLDRRGGGEAAGRGSLGERLAAQLRNSRPSIAARPSAINAKPGELARRQPLAEEQRAEQDRGRRDQQGDEQRIGRAGRGDQPEIEDVGEARCRTAPARRSRPRPRAAAAAAARAGRRSAPAAASRARRR